MSIGKTIRIYLNDGTISNIKHAEIINWTGQAISAPRTQIKLLSEWAESQKPGVYFLFGVDENTGNKAVYIGEAENVFERLKNHATNKDFWNEVVIFTSKDENLTKSHVKYLESRLVELAKQANRYVLLNGNTPQQSALPRGDKDSMEEFSMNLKTLLGVLGHKALEPLKTHEKAAEQLSKQKSTIEDLYFLNIKGITASAIINNEGILVLEGSDLNLKTADSLSKGYEQLRQELIENNVISYENSSLRFVKDQLFTSPSQAAAIIVGYAINGRVSWKNSQGVTLKELEES